MAASGHINIRHQNGCDLSDLDCGMIADAKRSDLSNSITADLFIHKIVSRDYAEWCSKENTCTEWRFCVWIALLMREVTGERLEWEALVCISIAFLITCSVSVH